MRKPASIVVGILAFLVAGYATRNATAWLQSEPAVSQDVVQRAWVAQSLVPGEVTFDAPWPLERQDLPFPPEMAKFLTHSVSFTHEADGVNVMTAVMSFVAGTPVSLEGAADGALANLKTVPGTRSVDGKKRVSTLLGGRAFDLEARIERERGPALQMYGVVSLRGNDLLQVLFISRSDQPLGAKAWERLRNSIRSPKAD